MFIKKLLVICSVIMLATSAFAEVDCPDMCFERFGSESDTASYRVYFGINESNESNSECDIDRWKESIRKIYTDNRQYGIDKIIMVGSTSTTADYEYNQGLSKSRIAFVQHELELAAGELDHDPEIINKLLACDYRSADQDCTKYASGKTNAVMGYQVDNYDDEADCKNRVVYVHVTFKPAECNEDKVKMIADLQVWAKNFKRDDLLERLQDANELCPSDGFPLSQSDNNKVDKIIDEVSQELNSIIGKDLKKLADNAKNINASTLINAINSMRGIGGKSVWTNAQGKFNTARLASDSIAGVVLGTAGGLITSHVVKKNQIKKGFENIMCTVGGQSVANYGDEFTVGITH